MQFTISTYKESNKKKRLKGKSLLEFPNDYIVLDLETTGLNPNYDEIIEIAALKIHNNEIIDTFSTFINPHQKVDDFIFNLTGITINELNDAPYIENVLPDLKDFLGDYTISGHNIHFDINFLYDSFEKFMNYRFDNDMFDLLRISRAVFPDLTNHKLSTLAKVFDIDIKGHHRAIHDCKITKNCIDEIKKYKYKNNISLKDKSFYKKSSNNPLIPDSEVNIDSYFYNKLIVFTGELEGFSRKEISQLATNCGAIVKSSVVKKTDILVVGSYKHLKSLKSDKTSKHIRAEELILKGSEIEIMDEELFYSLITDDDINKLLNIPQI